MKALALLSGGLDSILAVKLMLEQGIEVEALHFTTVFCRCGGKPDSSPADKDKGMSCGATLKTLADNFKIKIKNINNTIAMLDIIKKPKHGYGKNMNPCIDCRINMLKAARKYMDESGASFLVTGEVLGQRPMSQHLRALKTIEKETDLQGLILRPLSAQLLDPTLPEQNKWVDREKLLKISGRSRKEQMSLANIYEIRDYPCPAGGCLLTDITYAATLRDLLNHNPDFKLNDVLLIASGRHFRLNEQVKLIVGRNEKENQTIENLAGPTDALLYALDFAGPMAMIRGQYNEQDLHLAAAITARYADLGKPIDALTGNIRINDGNNSPQPAEADGKLRVEVKEIGKANRILNNIVPLTDGEIKKYWIYKIKSANEISQCHPIE